MKCSIQSCTANNLQALPSLENKVTQNFHPVSKREPQVKRLEFREKLSSMFMKPETDCVKEPVSDHVAATLPLMTRKALRCPVLVSALSNLPKITSFCS